jgi:16S rRNA processing protein RimM
MPDTANTVTGDYTVLAAHTAGAHGVSGSVRLRLVGGVASDENDEGGARSLKVGRLVRLVRESDGLECDLTLAALRRQPKGVWIARFKEVTDRSGGEGLQGCAVMIRESERAALPEGEFYVDQLLGLPVVTDTGRALGALVDVLSTPAHDVYVTDDGAMIPVAGDYIVRVDLAEKQIVVRDVPGLHGGE